MTKQTPTLNELSDPKNFEEVFRKVVLEMFGKKTKPESVYEVPHGIIDSAWTAGEHFSALSRELRDVINAKFTPILKTKVSKFSPENTKLTSDLIDLGDVWEEISKWIGTKIEEQLHKENGEIPGLEKGVKEGVIRTVPGKSVPQTTLEEREAVRKKFKEKLPRVNDEFNFLNIFRNRLYQDFQNKYNLFQEQESELRGKRI